MNSQTFQLESCSNMTGFNLSGILLSNVCCPEKPLAQEFLNLIQFFNFGQCVVGPTHQQSHRLDLVLSYGLSVFKLEIGDAVFLSINLFYLTPLLHVSLKLPLQPGIVRYLTLPLILSSLLLSVTVLLTLGSLFVLLHTSCSLRIRSLVLRPCI